MSRNKLSTGRDGQLGKIRNHSLHIRLNEDELKALEEKASLSSNSVAKYCRDSLLYEKKIKANVSQYTELLNQLNKIGVNLNQIAHRINKGQLFIVEEFKQELKALVTLKKQQYTKELNKNNDN